MIFWMGRVWQTWRFVSAWLRPIADATAQTHLTPAEFALYLRMSRPERQHHLRVLAHLLAVGQTHPALLKAALLHDVGKTRFRFGLIERVLVVLVKRWLPQRFKLWSQSQPQGWKRPFVVSAQHPQWSMEMGQQAGLDPLALELIARHQNPPPQPPQTLADHLLLHLQSADDRS
jgi:hypothetical protein